ncbi:MAG: sigma-54-dependent transcriptional regulator [Bryobacteraceae bacterium]
MAQQRISIVDDEQNIGRSLRLILEREGYAVTVCQNIAEAKAHPRRADAYLIDVRLPDGSGIDLVRWMKSNDVDAPVVMISGHGTIADAVEATRAGAFDFLEKPLGREKVLLSIRNALDDSKLREENRRLKEMAGEARMIGESLAFTRVLDQATMAARSDARILLGGESGTGKELLAAHIHANSPFAAGPFVKVNCAAIPTELIESELFGHEKGAFTGATASRRGKFELADGGTLFLDEVGDLHASSQAKLLRVLQEGEFHRVGGEQPIRVSVRVISATNRELGELVAQQKFREDLYYRLCVVPVRVPALRERREDIRPLACYFLADFCARNNFKPKTIDDTVFEALEDYSWPGNIRELRNIIERMAILTHSHAIEPDAVPVEIRIARASAGARGNLREAKESAEREHILRALEESKWNV